MDSDLQVSEPGPIKQLGSEFTVGNAPMASLINPARAIVTKTESEINRAKRKPVQGEIGRQETSKSREYRADNLFLKKAKMIRSGPFALQKFGEKMGTKANMKLSGAHLSAMSLHCVGSA